MPPRRIINGNIHKIKDKNPIKIGRTKNGAPPQDIRSITKLAKDKIGPAKNFNTVADYRHALVREKQRIRASMNNLELISAVESRLQDPNTRSVYRKEYAQVARIVASLYGTTLEEMAKFFRVATTTIQMWMKEYPEFDRAIRDRSTELNMQIMGRLARRALGFYANTEKIFYDVKRGDVVRVPTKEYYPPSEAAIMFWLKNRMPEQWKDLKDVNVDQTNKIAVEIYKNFDNMTPEQASDAYQALLKLDAPAQPQAEAKGSKRKQSVTDAEYTERDPKREPV